MLADLPIASWVLDRRTRRFLDVNDATVELYGFSRDDFAWMTLSEIWPGDEQECVLVALDQADSVVRSSGPWQHRHRDGHPLDVLISARRVDRNGRPTVVIVAEDVTAQRREEARLRASEERLRLALAAGQMGTWEWRPLDDSIVWAGPPGSAPGADAWRGKLVDFLQLVHPDDQERVARALSRSVVEQSDLTVELRVVAAGGATRWIMAFGRLIPDEQGAPALMIGLGIDLTDRKGLEFEIVAPDAALMVMGWPASLKEALTNLIFNAVDALPDGGTIRLTARRQHDAVVVEVADDGVGVPLDLRPRIFEPFFTTKGDRGTGLGLAQVLSIVRRHGGHVEIDAAHPWSTICRLVFPSSNQAETSVPLSSANEAGPRRRLRVLPSDESTPESSCQHDVG